MSNQSRDIWFLANTSVRSGAEIALINLIDCMKMNYNVTLVCGEYGFLHEQASTNGISLVTIPLRKSVNRYRKSSRFGLRTINSILDSLYFVYKLRSRLKKSNPGILHCNTTKANILGAWATVGLPTRTVWHVRDYISRDSYGFFPMLVIKISSLLADAIIANSQATLTEYLSNRLSKQNTAVIPSSVVYDPILDLSYSRNYPAVKDCFIIANVARLTPWKGQNILIQAIKQISSAKPFKVWFFGGALFGEEDYESELKDLVSRLGLSDTVTFFGHKTNLDPYWKEIDLLAHSPVSPEPFGQVIVEAQSRGIPVVVPSSGGAIDWIEHGKNGLFFETGNSKSLAMTIDRILSDSELYSRLSTNGLEAVKRFSPNFILKQLSDVYSRVLE